MAFHSFTAFSRSNRRTILQLIAGHLAWCAAVFALWAGGLLLETAPPGWAVAFLAVQIFAASQLLLPVLRLEPEVRSRTFYLVWGIVLALGIWLLNRPSPGGLWQPLLSALRSGMLLLAASVVGAVLARYVRRLWEIVPVCLVMTLADVASWTVGPTADFARKIERYYRAPAGPPPAIDMVLIKLALPGQATLAPVFGISDWIMVVFFAHVAAHYGVNDNLLGAPGRELARKRCSGRYLPVSVAALFAALLLAQASGLFIPALPLIAVVMLLWYAGRFLLRRILGS